MAAEFCKLTLEAGFPPDVFRVFPGDDSTGSLFASHMQVANVSFTGSEGTEKLVKRLAAKSNIKRRTLELEGRSPAVVFDDAELDNAVHCQVCFASSRVYIQEGICDRFLSAYRVVFEAKRHVMGDPNAPGIELGPVVDKAQYTRIFSTINATKSGQQGTSLSAVTPSPRPRSQDTSSNPRYSSTRKPNVPIYKNEVFGPVAVINELRTEDGVLQRANGSSYGLMADVFTENINRALRMSSGFDSSVD